MKMPKELLQAWDSGRGYRHYTLLKKFEINAHLIKIGSGQRWHYKMFIWPNESERKGTYETVFEYSSIGLPWNERRFIRALEDALDNETNRHRLITAAFDDFKP